MGVPGPGPVVDASFLGPRALDLSILSSRGGRGSLTVRPMPVSGPALLSKPVPVWTWKKSAGLSVLPSRSATLLLYSVLVRRWTGTCPGSRVAGS